MFLFMQNTLQLSTDTTGEHGLFALKSEKVKSCVDIGPCCRNYY